MSHSRGPQSSLLARESHVLLEERWALGWDSSAAPPRATCRKNYKLVENCSQTPPPHPHAPPRALGLPSPWELLGTPELLPRWWRGAETGHRFEVLLASSSVGLVHVLPHRRILWGRAGGGWHFLPLQKGIGAGGGEEWRKQNSEEKLCLGKAVALIQNDPFKGPCEAAPGSQVLSRQRHAPCV